MSIPHLKRGDLLYHGGFDAWRERLTAILTKHRLDHHIRINPRTACLSLDEEAQAAAALYMTIALIHPSVMCTIPAAAKACLPRLLEWLQMHTRPFRFSDLPPEIRNRVYDYLIPHRRRVQVRLMLQDKRAGSDTPTAPRGRMAITQASRQIREESLGLFYSRSVFCLNAFRETDQFTKRGNVSKVIHRWCESIPPGQIGRLLNVELSCSVYPRPSKNLKGHRCWVQMSYSTRRGLEGEDSSGSLGKRLTWKLTQYVLRTEHQRKLLTLQGEAIVLALDSIEYCFDGGGST